MHRHRPARIASAILLVLLAVPIGVYAAEAEKQGPPPAVVVLAKARAGRVALQNVFVGSVQFPEVSDVAAEVQGRVDDVAFEEGDVLLAGQVIVTLNNELLGKELEAAVAQYEQALADLENAKLEFRRMNTLYNSKSVSEKEFDEARLSQKGLQQKAQSFRAEAERLRLEIAKSRIRSPFTGIVLEKHAARGEWVAAGSVVATIAANAYVEAVVEVPQAALQYIMKGQVVGVAVNDRSFSGTVSAVIPQGNVKTRTFPVKVRIQDGQGLAQGMEVKVSLPAGSEVDAVLVPRDAVLNVHGQNLVWVAEDGKAASKPVNVEAWLGSEVAVRGLGVVEGSLVITKGNERLRPGQAVSGHE